MVVRVVVFAFALAACSTTRHDPRVREELVEPRRWLAGDLHMHVMPPDEPHEVQMSLFEIASVARSAELDFIVLTPHLYANQRGEAYDDAWREMAELARMTFSPLLIPGIEWSTPVGHFTIAGVDPSDLGDDVLVSAREAGAFISVNHPFAVPTRIGNIAASHSDLSYRAWTDHAEDTSALLDGAEVWNVPLGLANLISRPGGKTGEQQTWTALDKLVREQRRRVTAVGGTDNHEGTIFATTWVLATDVTETAILDALRAGATCVGGVEAGSFKARPADGAWVEIGGIVRTFGSVLLAWDGVARLFIDEVDQGEHLGGFVHATDGVLHTYRIAIGPSRCGFIYANLDS